MNITLLGMVWLIILLFYIFTKPSEKFIPLLILSTIFQASSVINIYGKGINFIISTELFFLIKYLFIEKRVIFKWNNIISTFLLFIMYSCIISILASSLFGNIQSTFLVRYFRNVDFTFNLNTLMKIIMLFFHFFSILGIYNIRDKINKKDLKNAILLSIWIVLIFGFWEFFSKIGLFPIKFPTNLIYTNIGYDQLFDQGVAKNAARLNSLFLEASYCGCFLSASLWWLITSKKKNVILIILTLIAIILNRSGTAIVSVCIIGLLYLIKQRNFKAFFGVLCVGLIIAILYYFTDIFDPIANMLINKIDSQSGIRRSHFNTISLEIFMKTYGLGGGLACYRASSFIFNLLCTTGLIGTILFIKFLVNILKNIKLINKSNEFCELYYFFITVIVSLLISLPDINSFTLWMAIFYAMSVIYNYEKSN